MKILRSCLILMLVGPTMSIGSISSAYEFNDSHFHLMNYIQRGPSANELLKIMGKKAGRVALFGIPLQHLHQGRPMMRLSFAPLPDIALRNTLRHEAADTPGLLSRLLSECAAFADLVRQAEKSKDADRLASLLGAIKSLLTEIRSTLFLLMGRKP